MPTPKRSPLAHALYTTLLTLLFLPALYAAWFRVRRDEPTADSAGDADAIPEAQAGFANI